MSPKSATDADVRRALGSAPLPDATHVLPPLVLPSSNTAPVSGPDPNVCFVVDLVADHNGYPVRCEAVQTTFGAQAGLRLGLAQKWGERRYYPGQWTLLDNVAPDVNLTGALLAWELASLLTEGAEAAAELAGYARRAQEGAARLGLAAAPRETPNAAAARAGDLIALKARFARSIEMRLLPSGRGFLSRDVWRAAYALGFGWANGTFFWTGGSRAAQLFLSPVGLPGQWLPDRAAEGEGTLGIALSFEVPPCPDPLGLYDRMANVLAYLRQNLGGISVTSDGQELDADRLWEMRDELAALVQTMTELHLAPGSAAALLFF